MPMAGVAWMCHLQLWGLLLGPVGSGVWMGMLVVKMPTCCLHQPLLPAGPGPQQLLWLQQLQRMQHCSSSSSRSCSLQRVKTPPQLRGNHAMTLRVVWGRRGTLLLIRGRDSSNNSSKACQVRRGRVRKGLRLACSSEAIKSTRAVLQVTTCRMRAQWLMWLLLLLLLPVPRAARWRVLLPRRQQQQQSALRLVAVPLLLLLPVLQRLVLQTAAFQLLLLLEQWALLGQRQLLPAVPPPLLMQPRLLLLLLLLLLPQHPTAALQPPVPHCCWQRLPLRVSAHVTASQLATQP